MRRTIQSFLTVLQYSSSKHEIPSYNGHMIAHSAKIMTTKFSIMLLI